jgi:hypothetical protein
MKFAYIILFLLSSSPLFSGEIRIRLELKELRFSHPEGVTGKAQDLIWESGGTITMTGVRFSGVSSQGKVEGTIGKVSGPHLEIGPYHFSSARGETVGKSPLRGEASEGLMDPKNRILELNGPLHLEHPRGSLQGKRGKVFLKEERIFLEKPQGVIRR